MSPSIKELRQLSTDELIARHDEKAKNTVVGTSYYLDELRRREQQEALEASTRLAHKAYILTWVNSVFAAIATIAAVLALWLA